MFKRLQISLAVILILLSAFVWAAHTPKQVAMKRESRIQPTTLAEALDLSLAYGYRSVEWAAVGMEG